MMKIFFVCIGFMISGFTHVSEATSPEIQDLAGGTKAGMRGCCCRQNSLLTGRRAMGAASITVLRGPLEKWC